MSAPPTISVVMPTYNGAALLGETLDSLAAQTFSDFEIIAVDDCSTDDTRAFLAAWPDPRLRVIHSPTNGGPAHGRNVALAAARGRYIAALDQDDLCRPDRLARQVAYLDARPETVALGTAATILEDGRLRSISIAPSVTTPASLAWLLYFDNPLIWSSMMFRAEAARTLDPFSRTDLRYAEDFDLHHRLLALGEVARIDDELIIYRRHEGGASQRHLAVMEANAQTILAAAYAPALGALAAERAMLVIRHVAGGVPVPDRATLAALGATLATLQAWFLANYDCDTTSERLIRWETARRWGKVVRAAVRSGALPLGAVMQPRPDHLGLGHAGVTDLIVSAAIGGVRRARA